MPRKNSDQEKPKSAVTLRRSPRFLQIVLAGPEDPKTPKVEQRRRTRVPSSATPLTLTGKSKVSLRKRFNSREICLALPARQVSDNLKASTRRSTRPNRCADESNAEKLSRGSNRNNSGLKRRVTRSSCRDVDKNAEKPDYGGFTENTSDGCSSHERITEEGVNVCKQLKGKSLKSKVKHSKKNGVSNSDRFDTLSFDDDTNEGTLAITEKPVLVEESSKKCLGKKPKRVTVSATTVVHEGPTNGREANKTGKSVGVKRRRNQCEDIVGVTQGWTKDQESALERAYLEAKPTPHFWKKVSRLVPGKSAQECFDKIHGSHVTPPQPHLRSRSRVSNLQHHTFSASKLLNSSSPKAKRPRYHRQKSHVVQRTVRHMLQNQYKAEQDSEADLFSVLEPTFTRPSNSHVMLSTPDRNLETGEILKRFQERSSTAQKKSVSRFSSSYGTTLVSPPVLKQVKNKALHEKYIDLLNCREANRKAAAAKAEKLLQSKEMSSAQRKNAIKAAKNALAFGARDAINEFQQQEATALIDFFDDEIGADADEDNGQVLF